MRKSDNTLKGIRKGLSKPSPEGGSYRVSDFLSKKKMQELRTANYEGRKKKALFGAVDALGAEICARFGYDVYLAWNAGEIDSEKVYRWLYAERAREAKNRIALESVVANMVGACIRVEKGKPKPKGPAVVKKILQSEFKIMKGEA